MFQKNREKLKKFFRLAKNILSAKNAFRGDNVCFPLCRHFYCSQVALIELLCLLYLLGIETCIGHDTVKCTKLSAVYGFGLFTLYINVHWTKQCKSVGLSAPNISSDERTSPNWEKNTHTHTHTHTYTQRKRITKLTWMAGKVEFSCDHGCRYACRSYLSLVLPGVHCVLTLLTDLTRCLATRNTGTAFWHLSVLQLWKWVTRLATVYECCTPRCHCVKTVPCVHVAGKQLIWFDRIVTAKMSRSKDADDVDIDYLLETLSPEELEKLGEELIDPDVSDLGGLPPSFPLFVLRVTKASQKFGVRPSATVSQIGQMESCTCRHCGGPSPPHQAG